MHLKAIFSSLIFIFTVFSLKAAVYKNPKATNTLEIAEKINLDNYFHRDSIHKFNFRYFDKKRGLKPYIAPAILITAGTALHLSPATKESISDFAQERFPYHGAIDDYLQFAPAAAVYGLNAVGIKGKNNFGNRTALGIKSFLLMDFLVNNLKNWTKTERPTGAMRSFPSGHTAFTFCMAHFMHKEYGELSPWYSIGAYSCATTVGIMRIAKNAHWASDVVAGAGIGILSTELVYLTHLYKWDNEHIKNLDILPFQFGRQKGLTLVYNF